MLDGQTAILDEGKEGYIKDFVSDLLVRDTNGS